MSSFQAAHDNAAFKNGKKPRGNVQKPNHGTEALFEVSYLRQPFTTKSSNGPHSKFHDLIRVKGAFACFPPSRRSVQAENLRGGASFEAHIDNELLSRDVSPVLACVESLRDSVRHTLQSLQSGLLLNRFLSSFFVASEQPDCKYDCISNYGHFDTACDIWCRPQTCTITS